MWTQLQIEDEITQKRRRIWERYHDAFVDVEKRGIVIVRNPFDAIMIKWNLERLPNQIEGSTDQEFNQVYIFRY